MLYINNNYFSINNYIYALIEPNKLYEIKY